MAKHKDGPKVIDFHVINFPTETPDGKTTMGILIYALADDGILYELAGGKWLAFPINPDFMRPLPPEINS